MQHVCSIQIEGICYLLRHSYGPFQTVGLSAWLSWFCVDWNKMWHHGQLVPAANSIVGNFCRALAWVLMGQTLQILTSQPSAAKKDFSSLWDGGSFRDAVMFIKGTHLIQQDIQCLQKCTYPWLITHLVVLQPELKMDGIWFFLVTGLQTIPHKVKV